VDRFSAVLGGDDGERPTVELPFDAKERYGKTRAPVRGRVNGVEFRTTVAVFEALSYTHRREYAEWIAQAKREGTRERRAAKALEMLKAGTRHP